MNTPKPKIPALHRRKLHYVDESLQKLLLIGLVLLEVSLAAGLAWLMYDHLNQVIEDNLYRVHLAQASPMLGQLLREALNLLGLFVAVNVLMLALVDQLWRWHVNTILRSFSQLMAKTIRLDFSADIKSEDRHVLLELAEKQRQQDRQRLTALHSGLTALLVALQDQDQPQHAWVLMQSLQQLLPQPHARAQRPPGKRRAGDSI